MNKLILSNNKKVVYTKEVSTINDTYEGIKEYLSTNDCPEELKNAFNLITEVTEGDILTLKLELLNLGIDTKVFNSELSDYPDSGLYISSSLFDENLSELVLVVQDDDTNEVVVNFLSDLVIKFDLYNEDHFIRTAISEIKSYIDKSEILGMFGVFTSLKFSNLLKVLGYELTYYE